MKLTTILILAASLMCGAIAFNQYDAYRSRHSSTRPAPKTTERELPSATALVGRPAPDFNLVSFDGSKTVKLSDYKGRPVILTFWATYCGWCRDEAPWLSQMQAKYANRGLQVLGIVPLTDSSREEVSHALETWGIKYPVLISDPGAELSYSVHWFPTTIYVDPKGIVAKAEEENVKGLAKVEENVQALLR